MTGTGPTSLIRHFVWSAASLMCRVVPLSKRRLADVTAAASLPLWLHALVVVPPVWAVIVGLTAAILFHVYWLHVKHAQRAPRPDNSGAVALDPWVERTLTSAEQSIVMHTAFAVIGPIAAVPVSSFLAIILVEVAIIMVHNPNPPRRTIWSIAAERISAALDAVAAAVSPTPAPTPAVVPTR